MLRAVGMSRRQVRRMVRHESIVTALVGATRGMAVGIFLAASLGRRRLPTKSLPDGGRTPPRGWVVVESLKEYDVVHKPG